MYDWVPLLYSRNWHNIVNQLYFNNFFFKKKTFNEWIKRDRKIIKENRIYLEAKDEQNFKKEEVVNIVKYHSQIQRMKKP